MTLRSSALGSTSALLMLAWFGTGCENSIITADDAPNQRRSKPECRSAAHCDDGKPCTSSQCTNGRCVHSITPQATCGVGTCTSGTCNEAGECVSQVQPGRACEDGNACTQGDVCDGQGLCTPGAPAAGEACDDGSACTVEDSCSAEAICKGQPAPTGTPCNDGDVCTDGDSCDAAGLCDPGSAIPLDDTECQSCSCHPVYGVECEPHLTSDCACNLYGKIKYVDSFPDFTIAIVTTSPDIEIEMVDSSADEPGEWEEVDSFEDYKVKVVESFPDIRVRFVDNAWDCP